MRFNFVDVGSRAGMPKVWKKEYINHIITFDPEDESGALSLSRYTGKKFHYPIAVFDVTGKRNFYICDSKNVSSLFKPDLSVVKKTCYGNNLHRWKIIDIVEIECRRLDEILEEIGIEFDFLKIDAQGANLNVLKSCGKFLPRFKGIQTECEVMPIYKGGSLIDELDMYLKNRGFIFVKKLPPKNNLKSKVWNDYLYVNKDASLEEQNFIKTIYGVK